MKFVTLFAFFIFCSATNMVAQPNTVQLQVSNQPAIPVVLGQVKGDKFIPVDSSLVQPVTSNSPAESGTQNILPVSQSQRVNNETITFHFNESATSGMYRLILGKTRVAEIMNEPPQQFDFIFNQIGRAHV